MEIIVTNGNNVYSYELYNGNSPVKYHLKLKTKRQLWTDHIGKVGIVNAGELFFDDSTMQLYSFRDRKIVKYEMIEDFRIKQFDFEIGDMIEVPNNNTKSMFGVVIDMDNIFCQIIWIDSLKIYKYDTRNVKTMYGEQTWRTIPR